MSDNTKITSVHLVDDGEGTPDEDILDGIYSGYFVPTRDGNYKFSILIEDDITYAIKYSKLATIESKRHNTKLLPVDQSDMGCSGVTCNMANLPVDFMRHIDLSIDLQVSGASDYTVRFIYFILLANNAAIHLLTYLLYPLAGTD